MSIYDVTNGVGFKKKPLYLQNENSHSSFTQFSHDLMNCKTLLGCFSNKTNHALFMTNNDMGNAHAELFIQKKNQWLSNFFIVHTEKKLF